VTTGALTVSVAAPRCPSLVAWIMLVPPLTAVTTPVALTVATALSDDDHVMAEPVSTVPVESNSVAVA
jgi:hypothetical protein